MLNKIKKKILEDQHVFELLKKSSSSFILKIFGLGLGYLTLLFITKQYGAETYGIYTIVFTFMSVFSLVPKFGMGTSLVRIIGELYTGSNFIAITAVIKRAIIISLILSIAFSIILFFSADQISIFLKKAYLAEYLRIIAFGILPNAILAVLAGSLQGMKYVGQHIFVQAILTQMFFLLLLFVDFWFEFANNIILLYVISQFIALLLSFKIVLMVLTPYRFKETNFNNTYSFKKIINVSTPMLLAGSIYLIMNWTDILMLGYYASNTNLGVYRAAQKVASLTVVPLLAINSIAAPKFIEFFSQNDLVGLKRIVQQSTKIIFFVTGPILILIILSSKTIMGFFGSEFGVGYLVLIVLSASHFVNAFSGSVAYIMQMTNNEKAFQKIILFASILNIVLNAIFIPLFGINGAAISSSVSMIIWNLGLVLYIKKKLGFWTVYFPYSK